MSNNQFSQKFKLLWGGRQYISFHFQTIIIQNN